MNRRLLLIFLAAILCLPSAAAVAEKKYDLPATEEGLPGEGALRRYAGYVKNWSTRRSKWAGRVRQDQNAVVFLGDSITQGWGDEFRNQFPDMKPANRGIGGDTTRGMLIRLQEDVLQLNPTAVVILAGTNDLEIGLAPELIARNFQKIIAGIKTHSKDTPIVVCRVFPSSASKKRPSAKIKELNDRYAAAVRGDKQVTLVDTYTLFAGADGDAQKKWFPDLLHLNAAGYEKWASALKPIFATLRLIETTPDAFTPEVGYVSLFNGKDLSGWGFRPTPPRRSNRKPRPGAPVFVEIKEAESFAGKTQSSDGRYEAINGRLVVKTPAEGRRIQQLWTVKEFGEDFILKLEFRATPNADSGVFIRKPQLQCRDYTLAGPYKDLKSYRPQQWNELVVTVKDSNAVATCNGELLTDKMPVPATGPIGLEGDRGQMEYRRIRVKLMP